VNATFLTVQRYWHTLRYLKVRQLSARVVFKLSRPTPDVHPAPALRSADRVWQRARRSPSMVGAAAFAFLNERRELIEPSDWNNPAWPKLWLYNLHYFDDLVADDAASRQPWHQALVSRWIAENPPARGNGWEPYPTSLRIVNWIKWAQSGGGPTDEAIYSLAIQARWLTKRLEYHLMGNHLWANAKALIFAGTYFTGSEAETWLAAGQRILRRELTEQILPDGGHFELSPMYHSIILEDVIDLLQLAIVYPTVVAPLLVATLRDAASRMLDWLQVMTHPDGEFSFFNDAALGIAPTLSTLLSYAKVVDVDGGNQCLGAITVLADSGYVRLTQGDAVLIADVAKIGPDYLPGHAHADTLSCELSIAGQRVLVNSGTSTYALGPLRSAQRATAAHNAVMVDSEDSSEVWAGFRVARRAYPYAVQCGEVSGGLRLSASHTGYERLPGRVHHRREWVLGAGRLAVVDQLDGGYAIAQGFWHFHPAIVVKDGHRADGVDVVEPIRLRVDCDGATAATCDDHWFPAFGVSTPANTLVLTFTQDRCETVFTWEFASDACDDADGSTTRGIDAINAPLLAGLH